MPEQISIVLQDHGDDLTGGAGGPTSAPEQMPSRFVYPAGTSPASAGSDSSSSSRGASKKKDEPTVTDRQFQLADVISKALGGVMLVDTAVKLKGAFEDIYKATLNLNEAMTVTAEAVDGPSSRGKTTVETVDPTRRAKADDEDVIDVPFSITPSRPVTDNSNPVDDLSKKLILPPRGLALPPSGLTTTLPARGAAAAGSAGSGSAVAAVAASAAPLAIAIAGVAAGIAAGAIVIKGAWDKLSSEVNRLEGYSPEVSVAASNSEIMREMAAIRRSDVAGSELARFEGMRARAEDSLARLGDQGVKFLAQIAIILEPALDKVIAGVDIMAAGFEQQTVVLSAIHNYLQNGRLGDASNTLLDLLHAQDKTAKAIRDFATSQKETMENEAMDPFMEGLLRSFGANAGNNQI